ncbi:UxaA family hydrolase [Halodesulfovibrio marinisediminis]|uniref:Altronate dehydratase small subunit n=1 Tax=Halodesulfovibrio marinisediminis DSM 17456 TaxID=1121457 RepID=A0A1N6DVS6_9BACT|nr:UxaA family hydrolase [Halodesulfovibrio marinisediminis]SIN74850.1 altronate dehydratase small subunit [Halodesulfovibrio marinisediminis DSM 17456]
MAKAIVMTSKDNVATALENINKGIDVELIDKKGNTLPSISVCESIPAGNKFALHDLKEGEPLVKYGVECGTITTNILQGHFVHVHNVKSDRIDIPAPIITEILDQMHYREGE